MTGKRLPAPSDTADLLFNHDLHRSVSPWNGHGLFSTLRDPSGPLGNVQTQLSWNGYDGDSVSLVENSLRSLTGLYKEHSSIEYVLEEEWVHTSSAHSLPVRLVPNVGVQLQEADSALRSVLLDGYNNPCVSLDCLLHS